MIDTRQTEIRSRVQTIVIMVVSILVFIALFIGIRSYEERVAVQAIRLAIEHRVDNVDYAQAGKAKDIDSLWAVYGPQKELTEEEFYRLADPIVDSHHTYLPLFIALMGGVLNFVMLGMGVNAALRARQLHKVLESKEMELQRSQEKLASVTVMDELTGLANKRHFHQVLSTECRRAVREFSPLTLMLIEVDKIEAEQLPEDYADQQAGLIAEVLKGAISRPGDMAARIDSGRFAMLLPATNEQSPVLADRLCHDIHDIELGGHQLSVSIGISTLQPSALLTAEYILSQTEAALHEALQSGGCQVRAITEDPRDIPVTFSN
ncbi:diguanylate cyclase (GGDEF) domain-containing protein [Amphritea atlantica]|uniref:diguanylate cyclase n=1 Tax=Amphritea atlantica TaxID=355243 RepID=A0A1H9DEJ1_9GAMM|nr:GGDEF domain-containing protein [Amphritea atlantica]SEQ11886.1 diguanylate cyclase (GGDEF) domain-containing protein [Amphritea atlantica]